MTSAPTALRAETADAAVIAASLNEPDRFGEIYDRHHHTVFRYVRSRVNDELVDDVVADTFVEAFRVRDRFAAAPGESCLPWLLGIATNVVARKRGAERRWLRSMHATPHDAAAPDVFVDADNRVAAMILVPWLAAALGELRRRDRDALLLHVAADLSIEEVAVALGIAPGTVKSRLHRARGILAAKLEARR